MKAESLRQFLQSIHDRAQALGVLTRHVLELDFVSHEGESLPSPSYVLYLAVSTFPVRVGV